MVEEAKEHLDHGNRIERLEKKIKQLERTVIPLDGVDLYAIEREVLLISARVKADAIIGALQPRRDAVIPTDSDKTLI